MEMIQLLKRNPVVPVAVVNKASDGLKLAEVLVAESITVIEVTARTPVAFETMARLRTDVPEITVGAGSLFDMESLKRAIDAGAVFGVAPCYDERVVDYAQSQSFPFVPGIATPSELNRALEKNPVIKLFPAKQLGGPDYIQAITAPFKMKNFHLMPTGGINEKNYLEYLAIDRVISCGMTYMVDAKLMENGDFQALRDRMKQIVQGLASR
jgi:2-dehydro-3-deoxyphosphogluconate aldolase/(4S)-4-hydroxy-2-oxoglutarate aldolase